MEVQKENAAIKGENAALQNRTQVIEAEHRDEITWLKKDREALENKTQIIKGELFKEKKKRMQLSIEVLEVRSALYQFSNKTSTDYTDITVRLDRCEANIIPFIQEMNWRRMQDGEEQVVGDAQTVHIFKRFVSTTHLSGRVDESNGGHRLLGEGGGADCSSAEITRQI
eukprot:SAG11_NODE_13526_length_651_cov_0.985507_2_plen_168_part_01